MLNPLKDIQIAFVDAVTTTILLAYRAAMAMYYGPLRCNRSDNPLYADVLTERLADKMEQSRFFSEASIFNDFNDTAAKRKKAQHERDFGYKNNPRPKF